MKKKLLILMLSICTVFALAACGGNGEEATAPEETEKSALTAGTEGTMFPWTYTEDDQIVGFEADIIAEISERTGREITMEAIEWSGLFGSLDAGRIDTVANIVTINDERREKYVFTEPYVYNAMVLATKSDSDIESMDDIDGRTIVVEAGSSDEQVVDQLEKEMGIKLERVYYEGISINDVVNGRVDLWIGSRASLNVNIEEGYDLRIVGETGQYQEYGYPFLKTDEGESLCKEFDQVLEEMREDGTLSEISMKWFDIDITQKPEAE